MNPNSIFSSYSEWLETTDMPKGQRSVLQASLTLFSQNGFDGTSTAQIAEAAGVSQGTIFKYYKTKQDLLKAIVSPVLQHLFPLIRDSFVDSLPAKVNLPEFIHFIVQDRFKFLVANSEAIQILVSELLVNQAVRDEFKRQIESSIPVFEKSPLAELQKAGQIRSDLSLFELARTFISQILMYFFQVTFSDQPQDTEADLAKLESLIVAEIQPQPKAGNDHVTSHK